jgi:hypothetical protein
MFVARPNVKLSERSVGTLRRISRRLVLSVAIGCLLLSPVIAHPGSGIAVDRFGHVYFLDTGAGLLTIDESGKLIQIPGPKYHWLALDANSRFVSARLPEGSDSGMDWDIFKAGTNPLLLLSSSFPIAIGQDGNLYYPSGHSGDLRLMRSTPAGLSSVFVTLPPTARGPLPHLNGIVAGPDESLYYTENFAIRRITAKGPISTVATISACADGQLFPSISVAEGPYLRGLAIDPSGVMYVAATGCGRVLKITPDGKVTTLVQTQSPWSPTGVALFGSDVYVLEYLHTARDSRTDWLPRVRKITADGASTVIASVFR